MVQSLERLELGVGLFSSQYNVSILVCFQTMIAFNGKLELRT